VLFRFALAVVLELLDDDILWSGELGR